MHFWILGFIFIVIPVAWSIWVEWKYANKPYMADITKCSGEGCPVKEQCYRFTAKANEHWQSVFVDVPGYWYEEKWKCDMYWGETQDLIYKQLTDIVNGKGTKGD